MALDRQRLKQQIHELYRREHEELGERGTLERLERGREWDLAPTLAAGGVAVFPHAGVFDCGHQIAAAVHGCLDSGADRVVVISVLHAFTDEMDEARARVSAGEAEPSEFPFWGIQGPGLDGRDEWTHDHALISWRHFWEAETKRRGVRGPEVVERYPYLAGGHPESLPGIEELAELAEDAVIVSTADPFHHGIGYGDPPERALPPHDGGLDLARATIEDGIALLERGDYAGYDRALRRGEERRARRRPGLPPPSRRAPRRDRGPGVHRRSRAVRVAGPDLGCRAARRMATAALACSDMAGATDLPSGRVTFLFTDVEGSTKLLERHPAEYGSCIARHHDLLEEAVEQLRRRGVRDDRRRRVRRLRGAVRGGRGGGGGAARARPRGLDAARARRGADGRAHRPGRASRRALLRPRALPLRTADGDRHGGQVVLSDTTAQLVSESLADGTSLLDSASTS